MVDGGHGKPAGLRGVYAVLFWLSVLLWPVWLFAVSAEVDPVVTWFVGPVTMLGAWALLYLQMRVGTAFALQKGWDTTPKTDAAWAFALSMVMPIGTSLQGPDSNDTSMAQFLSVGVVWLVGLMAWIQSGRRLAALAGDKPGGRSTFLRGLQIFCWVFSFTSVLRLLPKADRP